MQSTSILSQSFNSLSAFFSKRFHSFHVLEHDISRLTYFVLFLFSFQYLLNLERMELHWFHSGMVRGTELSRTMTPGRAHRSFERLKTPRIASQSEGCSIPGHCIDIKTYQCSEETLFATCRGYWCIRGCSTREYDELWSFLLVQPELRFINTVWPVEVYEINKSVDKCHDYVLFLILSSWRAH